MRVLMWDVDEIAVIAIATVVLAMLDEGGSLLQPDLRSCLPMDLLCAATV